MRKFALLLGLLLWGQVGATTDPFCTTPSGLPVIANPVLFVTQFPVIQDFATIGSAFANHEADVHKAARGGDLYIRYPNGKLCNLTREADFGVLGFQGAKSIAVRDPAVNASADQVVFSMVIGSARVQYEYNQYYWQLYTLTGLAEGQQAVVEQVNNQPQNFNNIMPAFGSDGRIIFVSDRTRNGARHLYPQHDEYESTATNTGLWSLDPLTGDLKLLEHSPSGSFNPTIDSFGRVIFTRWDHLQRDQQADSDDTGDAVYGTFDFADESATAATTTSRVEVFPEPRAQRSDLLAGTNLLGHSINHFFPWMINQDGTAEETLNHIGRHELHSYFDRSFNDDSNLVEFIAVTSGRTNLNNAFNMFQIKENPQQPGEYFATNAPEFQTHAAGMLVSIIAPPTANPDQMVVTHITHPDTETVVADGEPAPLNHSGHYRDPLPLSNGLLLAAHTDEARADKNEGTRANPVPRYNFQLKLLGDAGNGYQVAESLLTGGISKNISYFDPDTLVSYNSSFGVHNRN